MLYILLLAVGGTWESCKVDNISLAVKLSDAGTRPVHALLVNTKK